MISSLHNLPHRPSFSASDAGEEYVGKECEMDEHDGLDELAASLRTQVYEEGSLLAVRGQPREDIFLVLDGVVEVVEGQGAYVCDKAMDILPAQTTEEQPSQYTTPRPLKLEEATPPLRSYSITSNHVSSGCPSYTQVSEYDIMDRIPGSEPSSSCSSAGLCNEDAASQPAVFSSVMSESVSLEQGTNNGGLSRRWD